MTLSMYRIAKGSWSETIAFWHSRKVYLKGKILPGSEGEKRKICEEQPCKHQGERRQRRGEEMLHCLGTDPHIVSGETMLDQESTQ